MLSEALLIGAAAAFFAGALRQMTGFGFSMAATPLMMFAFAPRKAVVVVILLQILIGLPAARQFRKVIDLSALRLMSLGALMGAPFGAFFLALAGERLLLLVVGLAVCASCFVLASGRPLFRSGLTRRGFLVSGAFAGALGASIALPGPPLVLYYHAQKAVSEEQRRGMLMIAFSIIAAISAVVAAISGHISSATLFTALWLMPATLIGGFAGEAVHRNSNPCVLRNFSITLVFLAGVMCLFQAH